MIIIHDTLSDMAEIRPFSIIVPRATLICATNIEKMKNANPEMEESLYTCRYYVLGEIPAYGEWTSYDYENVVFTRGIIWESGTKSVIIIDNDVKVQIYFDDIDCVYVRSIICSNVGKFSCNITYSNGFPSATFYQSHVTLVNYMRNRVEMCGGLNGNLHIDMIDIMEHPQFAELEKLPVDSNIGAIEEFNTVIGRPRFRSYFNELRKLIAPKPRPEIPLKEDDDANTGCKICSAFAASYIMIPCGHRICCNGCYDEIKHNRREYLHKCVGCNVFDHTNRLMKMH